MMCLCLADDVPMTINRAQVVPWLCPGIKNEHHFSGESLYDVPLTEYDVQLVRAELSIKHGAQSVMNRTYWISCLKTQTLK